MCHVIPLEHWWGTLYLALSPLLLLSLWVTNTHITGCSSHKEAPLRDTRRSRYRPQDHQHHRLPESAVESSLHLSSLVLLLLREMRLLRPYSSRLHCHTSDKIHPKQDHILGFGNSKIISKDKHSAKRRIGIVPTTFWKLYDVHSAQLIPIRCKIYQDSDSHLYGSGFSLSKHGFRWFNATSLSLSLSREGR